MGSPSPHWTYAARAAYFGDQTCAFCEHHNPAGAKFCNECASPLHLKPCQQCDAVNDQGATSCYRCGATFPATCDAAPALPATDVVPAQPFDVDIASAVPRPLFVALLVLMTILIASAYATYHIDAAIPAPDALPIAAPSLDPPTVRVAVEPTPAEPERSADLPVAIPAVFNRPPPQRPTSVSHRPAAVRHVARVVDPRKAPHPDRWQLMHVSLARCGGDLIARIVCDQRVRRHFCEGHWGTAPDCAGRVPNDHGQ